MTEIMKNLTQHSVDDSTTVRIITYVSAIYLPASFVAVSIIKTTLSSVELTIPQLVSIWNELLHLRREFTKNRGWRKFLDLHCNVVAVDGHHCSSLCIDALVWCTKKRQAKSLAMDSAKLTTFDRESLLIYDKHEARCICWFLGTRESEFLHAFIINYVLSK